MKKLSVISRISSAGGMPLCSEHVVHVGDETVVLELAPRYVHAHGEIGSKREAGSPHGNLPASLLERPPPDGNDQAGVLRRAHELIG